MMKLSEAIRLGAMLRPQAFGDFVKYYPNERGVPVAATCALGAAFEAAGVSLDALRDGSKIPPGHLASLFPIQDERVACPCGCDPKESYTLRGVVAQLNDLQYWTRERIADWVQEQERTIEAQQQAEQPVEVPAHA